MIALICWYMLDVIGWRSGDFRWLGLTPWLSVMLTYIGKP